MKGVVPAGSIAFVAQLHQLFSTLKGTKNVLATKVMLFTVSAIYTTIIHTLVNDIKQKETINLPIVRCLDLISNTEELKIALN